MCCAASFVRCIPKELADTVCCACVVPCVVCVLCREFCSAQHNIPKELADFWVSQRGCERAWEPLCMSTAMSSPANGELHIFQNN